jgi:Ca2+-binding RTX toxin-like protein
MNSKVLMSLFNYSKDKESSFLIMAIFAFIFLYHFPLDAEATHLSKPVVVMNKATFETNETMIVTGWVNYFGPTSDVLLDALLRASNGTIAAINTSKSDSFGNFSFNFRLSDNVVPGKYIVQIISQCREEHREICANGSTSFPIVVVAADNNASGALVHDNSDSLKRASLTNQLLKGGISGAKHITGMNQTREQIKLIHDCTSLKVTLHGTPKNDVLIGTNGNDIIDALDGNDTIYGLEGNDIICGGKGDDIIFGELGNDKIYGGSGNDHIYGGYGYDMIDGGSGNDHIYGEYGYDILYGGNDNDAIDGGTGYNQCLEAEGLSKCG